MDEVAERDDNLDGRTQSLPAIWCASSLHSTPNTARPPSRR